MTNQQIPPIIHESWYPYLQPLFNDEKMSIIKDTILPKINFYPASKDIFKVFEMPIWAIKVVILGQDPYPNGEANGLAFAVNPTVTVPTSLRIISKEVYKDSTPLEYNDIMLDPRWKTLLHWHKQGVFLLNTALTVEAKNAGSHIGYWQWFTKEIIKIISLHATHRPIWLMWGAKAKALIGYVHMYMRWDGKTMPDNYSYILEANHPASECYGDKYKFSGCNHFNITNEILKQKKQTIISW